jgi:hypothetical protein
MNDSHGIDTTKEMAGYEFCTWLFSHGENETIQYKLYRLSHIFRCYFIRDSKASPCLGYNCSARYWRIEKFHYPTAVNAMRFACSARNGIVGIHAEHEQELPFSDLCAWELYKVISKFLYLFLMHTKRTLYRYSFNKTVEISKILEAKNDQSTFS